MFLNKHSSNDIAKALTKMKIPTPNVNSKKWYQTTIESILQNEKYIGDALIQKTYTCDFLTKKKAINKGEVPQYYIKDNHRNIISRTTFNKVKNQIQKHGFNYSLFYFPYYGTNPLSGHIHCSACNSLYGKTMWHPNSKYRKVIYRCNGKNKAIKCKSKTYEEDTIKDMFYKAIYELCNDQLSKEKLMKKLKKSLPNINMIEEENVLLSSYLRYCDDNQKQRIQNQIDENNALILRINIIENSTTNDLSYEKITSLNDIEFHYLMNYVYFVMENNEIKYFVK